VTHSISAMLRKVRAAPGRFGLVTANGNYVTKHSFGIYSTTPTKGSWQREQPSKLQAEIDALPKAPFTQTPDGPARIETYTVMHGRNGPEFGLIIGRLDATGQRFIANPPADPAVLMDLQNREGLGRPGMVASRDGHNEFVAA
jgi:acetyl-CoA C-acetyltransferase